MRVSFNRETARDFGPRYAETYGFLIDDKGERKLIYVTETTDSAVYFQTRDGDNIQYHAVLGADVSFEFIPVNRGFFNGADGMLYHVERVPARQWRRGIGRNNTQIYSLSEKEGPFAGKKINFKVLEAIFSAPSDYKFAGKTEWVAISKHFATTASGVYFHHERIGRLNKNKLIVSDACGVVQELKDALARNNYMDTLSLEIVNNE